jgi:hypothetical protein
MEVNARTENSYYIQNSEATKPMERAAYKTRNRFYTMPQIQVLIRNSRAAMILLDF